MIELQKILLHRARAKCCYVSIHAAQGEHSSPLRMLRAQRTAFMADIAVKSPGRQQGAALLERGMLRNVDIKKTIY